MVHAKGKPVENIIHGITESYKEGITDEFIEPLIAIDETGLPIGQIQEGDVVLFFNFRTDRGRELTQALSQQDYSEQGMEKLDLYYVTLTNYHESFQDVHVVNDKENIRET